MADQLGIAGVAERCERVCESREWPSAYALHLDGEPVWRCWWERDGDALRWTLRAQWLVDPEGHA